jgi:hydrogenase-4 membrane subunit HyfE
MKIGVSRIVIDHLNTLRNAETGRIALFDLVIFFLLPIFGGLASLLLRGSVTDEFYNVSITFFGIFIALLLNVQVAIFGIFLRKWDSPRDDRLAEIKLSKLVQRNLLLKEVNANISYLILTSCLALVFFLIMFSKDYETGIYPALSVVLYCHFMLTLLMVVKRSHALFQREYID